MAWEKMLTTIPSAGILHGSRETRTRVAKVFKAAESRIFAENKNDSHTGNMSNKKTGHHVMSNPGLIRSLRGVSHEQ